MRQGAKGYLVKPVKAEQLFKIIDELDYTVGATANNKQYKK
jgi:two-component SAPR family response regulator